MSSPVKKTSNDLPKPAALSPCVQVCQIDQMLRLCLGCGRTLEEIGSWSKLSDPQRLMIMQQLPGRMKKLEPQRKAASIAEETN